MAPQATEAHPRVEERLAAPGELLALEAPAGAVVEYSLDGGLLRPLAEPLRAPGEGWHWLVLVTRDALGGTSEPRWVRLRVDGTPPELRVLFDPAPVEGPGISWLAPGTRARVEATDGTGVRAVALCAGGLECRREAAACEIELREGGPVDLVASAADVVGNRTEQTVRAFVDRRPPAARLRLLGPQVGGADAIVVGPSTRARPERADEESGVGRLDLRLDGAVVDEAAWSGPWPRGPHRLEVQAFDRVGNPATTAPLAVVADDEPPRIRHAFLAPATVEAETGPFLRPPARVAVRAEDAPAGLAFLECTAGAASLRTTIEGELPAAGDGARCTARDRVGNEATADIPWRLDGEPPRLRLLAPSGELPATGVVTLRLGDEVTPEAVDAGAGVGALRFAVGTGPLQPVTGPLVFSRPGRFRLRVVAEDRLGNTARTSLVVRVRTSR